MAVKLPTLLVIESRLLAEKSNTSVMAAAVVNVMILIELEVGNKNVQLFHFSI